MSGNFWQKYKTLDLKNSFWKNLGAKLKFCAPIIYSVEPKLDLHKITTVFKNITFLEHIHLSSLLQNAFFQAKNIPQFTATGTLPRSPLVKLTALSHMGRERTKGKLGLLEVFRGGGRGICQWLCLPGYAWWSQGGILPAQCTSVDNLNLNRFLSELIGSCRQLSHLLFYGRFWLRAQVRRSNFMVETRHTTLCQFLPVLQSETSTYC